MDQTLFYIGTFSVLWFAIICLLLKSEIAPLFGFIGGLIGIFVMVSANSDGSITTAVAYAGGFQTQTMGLWPALYLPLLFIILSWGMALYKGTGGR
jgi:hypothetical protein